MSPPIPVFLQLRSGASGDESTDLWRRLSAGERGALDDALVRYWTPAVRYAARWVDQVEDAKDIAQDAFLELWKGAPRWAEDTRIQPLLFGIIRNLALKHRRRLAVRSSHSERVDITPGSFGDPASTAIANDFEGALLKAIECLPERRRMIFSLSRQNGMSHQEIAKYLDISPQTVANQLSAAMRQLREALLPFLDES